MIHDKIIEQITPYSELDRGDEYGEYVNSIIDLDTSMMTANFYEAWLDELRLILHNYKTSYSIVEKSFTQTFTRKELVFDDHMGEE